jgi:site-specific recombinase XerD
VTLSGNMESPQAYHLAILPRSITWAEVERVLAGVDRRTPCGSRDYAILLLLVVYGLRGHEVAGPPGGRRSPRSPAVRTDAGRHRLAP